MTDRKRALLSEVLYRLAETLVPFAVSVYAAGILGVKESGLYTHSLNVISWFTVIVSLGIQEYGIRSVAPAGEKERNVLIPEIASLQFLIGCAAMSACFLYLILRGYEGIVYRLQMLRILGAMLDLSWVYRASGRFERHALIRMCTRGAGAALIFLTVRKGRHPLAVYTLLQAGIPLSACVLLRAGVSKTRMRAERKRVFAHAVPLLRIFIPSLVFQIFHMMDRTMLGMYGSMEQLGLYAAADRYVHIPAGFVLCLCSLFMPDAVRLCVKPHSYSVFLRRTCETMLYGGIVLACLCGGCAFSFFQLFYGEEFAGCGSLAVMLAPVIVVKAYTGWYRSLYLIPQGAYRRDLVSVICGICANALLNRFLIPAYGAAGAVIGTCGAEVLIAGVYLCGGRKAKLPARVLGKLVLSACLLAALAFVPVSGDAALMKKGVLSGAAGAAVFFLMQEKESLDVLLAGKKRRKNETG